MKAKIKSITQLDFFRNVVHTVVSKILFIGIGVATSIIIMRTLGPELRGVYAKALAISSFAVQFGTLGFHASNTYFTAKSKNQMGSIAANSAYISALIGALSLLGLWGAKVLFPNVIQFSYLEIFLIVLTIPTQLLGMLWKAVAQGMEWFKLINVTEVALRLVYFVVMMGLWLGKVVNINTLLVAVSIEQLGSLWWMFRKMKAEQHGRWSFSFDLLKEQSGYSFRAYLSAFFAFMVIKADVFMVDYYAGKEQLGYYSTATLLVDYAGFVGVAIAAILMPRLSGTENLAEIFRLNWRVLKNTAFLMSFVVLGTWFLGGWGIEILFGKAFVPAEEPLKILILSRYLLWLQIVVVQVFNATGLPWRIIGYWVVAVIVNIVANAVWIPQYGIVGASWASVLAHGVDLLLVGIDAFLFYRNRVKKGLATS